MQQQMIKTLKENLKWENYYSLLKITKRRQSNQVFGTTVMISKNNDSKPQNLIIFVVNQTSLPHYCFICTFALWAHLINKYCTNKSPTPLTLQYKHCKYTQSTGTTVCTVHFIGCKFLPHTLYKEVYGNDKLNQTINGLITCTSIIYTLIWEKILLFHILLATHKLLNTCNGSN